MPNTAINQIIAWATAQKQSVVKVDEHKKERKRALKTSNRFCHFDGHAVSL